MCAGALHSNTLQDRLNVFFSLFLCLCLSFSLFLFLSVCLSVCLSLSVSISACLCLSLSVCLSVCFCLCLCLCLSVCLSLFLSLSLANPQRDRGHLTCDFMLNQLDTKQTKECLHTTPENVRKCMGKSDKKG